MQTRWPVRSGARTLGSSTLTTSTPPSAGARSPRRGRRCPGRAAPAPVPPGVRDRGVFSGRPGVPRCHGRNTLPGSRSTAGARSPRRPPTAPRLTLWQRRLAAQADAFWCPAGSPRAAATDGGAGGPTFVLPHVIREFAERVPSPLRRYALVAHGWCRRRGGVAIEACRLAAMPLVVAGEGPERSRLAAGGRGAGAVCWPGAGPELSRLRGDARMALVPSRSAETFALAAAEAMAAGLPVAGSRIGGCPNWCPSRGWRRPGDAQPPADSWRVVATHVTPRRSTRAGPRSHGS